jgi:hypothetical protein
MKERGSLVATINFFLAGLLILAAAGWSIVQKGCNAYFQREANAFFEKIEERQVRYRNVNNRYLPFTFEENAKAFKELKIDPKDAHYYDYSATETGDRVLRIAAQAKPEMLRKWYLHNPGTEVSLVYEKREGQKGKRVR